MDTLVIRCKNCGALYYANARVEPSDVLDILEYVGRGDKAEVVDAAVVRLELATCTCNRARPLAGWWPKNPYPADIFVMPRDRYAEIVPDPDLRTGLSGMLGRAFWDIASDAIWEALQEAIEDGNVVLRP